MGAAGARRSPPTPRLRPRRPWRRPEAPGVRCNRSLRGTLGARCALRSPVTSPRESSPGSSASRGESTACFPRDERCLQGQLPGPTRERRVAPPFASLEVPGGSAAFAERPLPPSRCAALLTWLQLVGCNFPASLRPAPSDAARTRAPAGRSAARELPSRAPAAARRSPASQPRRGSGRPAASSRVLRDRETGLINFCLRLPGPAPIDRRSASAQMEDQENACRGSLYFWATAGGWGGGAYKSWPLQQLIPRLILSL